MEPEQLKRGKKFHRRVQRDWNEQADGRVIAEHVVVLTTYTTKIKKGRLDIYVCELGDFVTVVEIKSTDWDLIRSDRVHHLLAAHRRQIWKYIDEFVDRQKTDVCPGMIYPRAPVSIGRREMIENYMIGHGIPVVWYDD